MLGGERGQQLGAELSVGAAEPGALRFPAGDDQPAVRCEGAAQVTQGAVPAMSMMAA
ncbi:hypothetical protein M2283_002808 [Streptomyces pseudovenezuelae]|uniref:Uncharacterized protein n=1 Tax=Streptomyces pseudovenezuelae TaxID=67350 RepID=A0ABT6LJF7_9ACTN|nr:hypothetical protein [Streptomyces pseudovenezuelae]MDH6215504.1 hypothetical protein [Streptomyces pseudovenezuelae]